MNSASNGRLSNPYIPMIYIQIPMIYTCIFGCWGAGEAKEENGRRSPTAEPEKIPKKDPRSADPPAGYEDDHHKDGPPAKKKRKALRPNGAITVIQLDDKPAKASKVSEFPSRTLKTCCVWRVGRRI